MNNLSLDLQGTSFIWLRCDLGQAQAQNSI